MSEPTPLRSGLCELLHPFYDGELSEDRDDAFRDHMVGCASCQAELEDLMQLTALASRSAQPVTLAVGTSPDNRTGEGSPDPTMAGAGNASVPEVTSPVLREPSEAAQPDVISLARVRASRLPSRRAALLAASGAVAIAAGVMFFVIPNEPGVSAAQRLARHELAPTRHYEARPSFGGVDEYRPRDVQRSGSGREVEDIPLDIIVALEKTGNTSALAAAYFLTGREAKARELLERAEPTPDVYSDRAFLAIESRQRARLETALGELERALQIQPEHPQALWNRALVLRELGRGPEAAAAFDEVTKLGEPGWSDEARAHASKLRRQP